MVCFGELKISQKIKTLMLFLEISSMDIDTTIMNDILRSTISLWIIFIILLVITIICYNNYKKSRKNNIFLMRKFWIQRKNMPSDCYNHFVDVKIIDVDVTEEMIFRSDALPKAYRSWRFYRVEYGGCNEACLAEGGIYLPPEVDASIVPQIIMGMNAYWQIWKIDKELVENTHLPTEMKYWETHEIEYVAGEMVTRIYLPPFAKPDFFQWIVKTAKET